MLSRKTHLVLGNFERFLARSSNKKTRSQPRIVTILIISSLFLIVEFFARNSDQKSNPMASRVLHINMLSADSVILWRHGIPDQRLHPKSVYGLCLADSLNEVTKRSINNLIILFSSIKLNVYSLVIRIS